jgi:hypothetical protein
MPLASASSTTVGSSNLTVALSRTPSSLRSTCIWVTSAPVTGARATPPRPAAAADEAHPGAAAPLKHRARARWCVACTFFQHRVEETVVVTCLIVRDALPAAPFLGQ